MEESKELKTGQTAQYEIEGKTVVMKPLTLGKMKKAMMAFQKKSDTFEMMQEALFEILSGNNEFATREWINNNVTMPQATQIINDMRKVNGMEDFLGERERKPAATLETRDLIEKTPTPSV